MLRDRRNLGAVVAQLGTVLEFYDFFIFGAAAATVFPALFYPTLGKIGGAVATMVAYGIGYADRPVGALLFRRFGRGQPDTRLLVAATVLVGVPTTAIGLLPTHSTIGAPAGVLLIVLRGLQGIGLGGEWARVPFAMADQPDPAARGMRATVAQLAAPVGMLMGYAVFAIAAAVAPGEDYLRWGWRVPFLFSGVLITGLLAARLPLPRVAGRTGTSDSVNLLGFCRLHWRELLIAIAVRAGSDAAFYVMALYVLGYVTGHLGLSKSVGFTAVVVGACAQLAGISLFGALAVRVPRRWIVVCGALASAVWAFAYFILLDSRIAALIYLACGVGVFCNAAMWSPARVFIPELFPPGLRHAGTGLGFQLAAIFGGGVTPLMSVVLVAWFGSGQAVAVYIATLLLVSATAAALAGGDVVETSEK